MALDHGPHGTVCLQALYRELKRPQFQKGICHLCGTVFNSPYFHHYILSHTHLSNLEQLISSLSSADLDIFMHGNFTPGPLDAAMRLSNSYFISSAVPLLAYIQGCRFGTMEPQVVPKGLVWCQERFFWCQIICVG